MQNENFVIEKPFLWTLFFYFSGMFCQLVFNTLLVMDAYWIKRINNDINAYWPFFFNAGQLSSFFAYNFMNQLMHFNKQLIIIPITLSVIFMAFFIIGESMETGTTLKTTLFLVLVTVSGFITMIFNTSIGRFAFSFRDKDINAYSSAGSLIGVLLSLSAFTLNFILGDERFTLLYVLFYVFFLAFVITSVTIFSRFLHIYYTKEINRLNPSTPQSNLT